ncbi:MAG TPA: class I SAM-dependent methyltransferase [Gaiellaceae bacterium]
MRLENETPKRAVELDEIHDPIAPECRLCGAPARSTLIDLGASPLCESYLRREELDRMEPFYPLHVRICEECLLVQLPAVATPETIFSEYAYYSSYSPTWVEHARRYTEAIVERTGLRPEDLVLEVASNDGYLLRHLVERGFRVLGVEPAANVAETARAAGVPTLVAFFGAGTAERVVAEHGTARLVVANNVLAQVPDLHDFVAGLATVLAPDGVLTLEFPHLVRLVEGTQFDTIYHEHFSYFTLHTARRALADHGLEVFDVEELPTHGGSLRVYAAHAGTHEASDAVAACLDAEAVAGYTSLAPYKGFRGAVERVKHELLGFLIDARDKGRSVAGYGAPGKGNTLLNYCGIRTDLIEFVVDRNPYKQGRFLPGTRIPILPPEALDERKPEAILILPWNLRDEVAAQLAPTRAWGALLFVAIPCLQIL